MTGLTKAATLIHAVRRDHPETTHRSNPNRGWGMIELYEGLRSHFQVGSVGGVFFLQSRLCQPSGDIA
jgi:hypothetical protein